METWGLTGGIASGKSTVAALFAELGVPVIDADQVARELSAPGGDARPLIRGRFGDLTKDQLRELVFNDARARRDLEAILHPMIRDESERRLAELASQGHALAIYEAALLFESGRAQASAREGARPGAFAGIIAVVAGRDAQKARLLARGMGGAAGAAPVDGELAERILSAQWTDEQRRAAAQVVFENSGGVEGLRPQVHDFLRARGLSGV